MSHYTQKSAETLSHLAVEETHQGEDGKPEKFRRLSSHEVRYGDKDEHRHQLDRKSGDRHGPKVTFDIVPTVEVLPLQDWEFLCEGHCCCGTCFIHDPNVGVEDVVQIVPGGLSIFSNFVKDYSNCEAQDYVGNNSGQGQLFVPGEDQINSFY